MRLTSEQTAVVSADEARFTVRAGAGSGKTRVLVDRYVRHVVELGQSPDEIVAVTFTRKAAAEMKGRIVNVLRSLGRTEDAQVAETGPIQTLHGFCERILRENCVEALVSPEFEVLDNADVRLRTESAVRAALLQALDEDRDAAQFVRRLSGQGGQGGPGWTHSQLRSMVESTMDQLRGAGLDRYGLSEAYGSVDRLRSTWSRALFASLGLDGEAPSPGPMWAVETTARLQAAGTRAPSWLKPYSEATERASAEDTAALVSISLSAWELLEDGMEADQKFDFALLERRAVSLVETSEVTRARLFSTVKAILVDEAQDLNPLQYRLIDSLKAPSEMLVGDPQQSIYGFRFAERGLFVDRSEALQNYLLTRNYRSQAGILRFVDEVFAPTWGDGHMPMLPPAEPEGDDPFSTGERDFSGVEIWPVGARDTGALAALIHQMVAEGTDPSKVTVLTKRNSTISAVAEKLTALGLRCRKVGGSESFLTRLEVRDLANALEALCDPYGDYAMVALLHGPMVGVSLDTLVLAAARPPVYESLRSMTDLPDDDAERLGRFWPWFEQLRETADRVPAWETISALFSVTPFLERTASLPHAEQALANVRKMLAMAVARPEVGAREFADQIHDVTFLKHREGEAPVTDENEDAVTLMTVFKAKGLEFDTVVVAETHDRLTPRRKPVAMRADQRLVAVGLPGRHSSAFLWLSDMAGQREREEQLRVLYVALTRAKNRLCVVVSEEPNSESAAGILASRAGFPRQVLPGVKVRRVDAR